MVARLDKAIGDIRRMQRADLAEVYEIECEAYEFGWNRGVFRDCLIAGHECWVLYERPEIIGYAVLANQADEAHLLNLCVAPAWQRCGHGARLLQRMIHVARWHAATRVLLEVRPSNPAAVQLYKQHGFRTIGRRPRYYPARNGREDAIVMELPLQSEATE